jgi:glycosyltransferase involved in cell wall biosynthesis
MHILVAQNASRAKTGGASRVMGFIHEEIEKVGHVVDYLCADDVPTSMQGKFARFTFPLLVRRRALAAGRVGNPYDIITVHEPSAAAVVTARRALGHVPIVVMSYGLERRRWRLDLSYLQRNGARVGIKKRIASPLTTLWQAEIGLRLADHVLCSNSEDQDFICRIIGRSPNAVTRVFSGATSVYAAPATKRWRVYNGRILFAGSWIERKGIRELASAFTTLANRHPELTLIVLGSGEEESVIREAFPESIRQRVFSRQASNDTEASAFYACADIFVLPSRFEGTPLTLIEAMASALPVVTTATCGMRDVIRHGENGLLVRPLSSDALVEAVERLRGDPGLREYLGRAASKDAREKYTWDRIAQPVLQVYERLCTGRKNKVDA